MARRGVKKVTWVLVNKTPGQEQPCFNHLEEGVEDLEWSREHHASRELFVSKTKVKAASHPVALTIEQPSTCGIPFCALSWQAWMLFKHLKCRVWVVCIL